MLKIYGNKSSSDNWAASSATILRFSLHGAYWGLRWKMELKEFSSESFYFEVIFGLFRGKSCQVLMTNWHFLKSRLPHFVFVQDLNLSSFTYNPQKALSSFINYSNFLDALHQISTQITHKQLTNNSHTILFHFRLHLNVALNTFFPDELC